MKIVVRPYWILWGFLFYVMWIVLDCNVCKEYKLIYEFVKQKQCIFGRQRLCKDCNRSYHRIHQKEWREKDIENYRNKNNEYYKKYNYNRRIVDNDFKNIMSIRNMINTAIKNRGYRKNSKTFDILGCDYETFKAYFESLFKPGMTWENHGEWHIDHIYPVSRANNEQHLLQLNHYTNLQPLWAYENLSKGNKINTIFAT